VEPLFATCLPGLENLLAAELVERGLLRPKLRLGPPAEPGGVAFDGGARELYRALRGLSLAERVFARHGPFAAGDFAALEKAASLLPWERYLPAGAPLAVRAESRGSKVYHEKGIAERVARGAGLRLKRTVALVPWDEEKPAPLAYARVAGDKLTVDVDACGAPLHRRGWRLQTAKAPLRETLAAALLRASGWDGRSPLADPFCGSGTIVIEAALRAQGTPPGSFRHFACEQWPSFEKTAWDAESRAARASAPSPRILASDRDAGAVAAAQANAERAGVAGLIEFAARPVSALELPPGPGWVVTNPPYGVRVSEGKDLRDLYAALGKTLRAKAGGWEVCLLTADAPLARAAGLGLEPGIATLNGGLPVKVWRGRA
jgi:putative N6-adenine-specific DNA methylase